MDQENQTPHKRRVRYKGKYPKKFEEKYKELQPEKYQDTIQHVIQKGNTPAGMHISIMVQEILDFLQIQPGQVGFDATLGYGGHTKAMLACLKGQGHMYATDVDPEESAGFSWKFPFFLLLRMFPRHFPVQLFSSPAGLLALPPPHSLLFPPPASHTRSHPSLGSTRSVPASSIYSPGTWIQPVQVQPNPAGTVFLDCESAPDASDFHSIFYGHHMKDGSRFSELIRLKDEDFFQKHRTAYLYFPDGKRRTLRLIAALTAGSQGERRRTEFADRSEMHPYIEEMTEGCWFRELPDEEVSHLYSFVTCSYEFADARTIVYAVDE